MHAALAAAEKQIGDVAERNCHIKEVFDAVVCNGETVNARKVVHVGTHAEVSDTDAGENRVL